VRRICPRTAGCSEEIDLADASKVGLEHIAEKPGH
jgi:hypothetical protein